VPEVVAPPTGARNGTPSQWDHGGRDRAGADPGCTARIVLLGNAGAALADTLLTIGMEPGGADMDPTNLDTRMRCLDALEGATTHEVPAPLPRAEGVIEASELDPRLRSEPWNLSHSELLDVLGDHKGACHESGVAGCRYRPTPSHPHCISFLTAQRILVLRAARNHRAAHR
jgi:hypothetical protein